MKTNFFSAIAPLMDGCQVKITIKKKDDQLILSILNIPRIDDKAKNKIRPLIFNATPDQLDEHFFEQISAPMQATSKWALDMKEFEKNLAMAKTSSQKSIKGEEAINKTEKEIKGFLDKADELIAADKPRQAIVQIEKALKINKVHVAALKLLNKAKRLSIGDGDLFTNHNTESHPVEQAPIIAQEPAIHIAEDQTSREAIPTQSVEQNPDRYTQLIDEDESELSFTSH